MDELTLLRSTRDDTLEPSAETLASARASLLTVATTDPAPAARLRRIAARGRRWLPTRRGLAVAGVALVSGVALTAAASVWVPALWVGPDAQKVDVDLVLPVVYTTLSGESIRCTYGVYFNPEAGRANLDAALSALHNQDWTSFGDDVKNYALAHPFIEGDSADTGQRERIAFELAAATIVRERAGDLLPEDTAISYTNDCPGRLS